MPVADDKVSLHFAHCLVSSPEDRRHRRSAGVHAVGAMHLARSDSDGALPRSLGDTRLKPSPANAWAARGARYRSTMTALSLMTTAESTARGTGHKT
jgi:hypothetical protein